MGDLENDDAHNAESWLCKQHDAGELDLSTDVLFGGHHGSHNATSEAFLDRVDPEAVVVSSGLDNNHNPPDNQYNAHPRDETLERLHERDIDVHWTAVHGTVSLSDDGDRQLAHDTQLETTDAADLAALKYYGRENDLDQEDLAEIETLAPGHLPEETPNWVVESAPLMVETTEAIVDTAIANADTVEDIRHTLDEHPAAADQFETIVQADRTEHVTTPADVESNRRAYQRAKQEATRTPTLADCLSGCRHQMRSLESRVDGVLAPSSEHRDRADSRYGDIARH